MQKTLGEIIRFVASRTDISKREDILREINFAWGEIWNGDDLPNSVFEITVKATEAAPSRLSLPYFIGAPRAVKTNGNARVTLNSPRPYYQSDVWAQSPYTFRLLGTSALSQSITNATRLNFSLAKPNTVQFKITIIGPSDVAETAREQIVVPTGVKAIQTTNSYSDVESIVKDTLIDQNVNISGANNEDFGIIPNLAFEARNVILQLHDKCNAYCTSCLCWDVLYKRTPPVLYYDEQLVDYPEVLMTKTLEWITMPKEGQETKTTMWAGKTRDLLSTFNADKEIGVSHVLDVAPDRLYSYTGSGSSKL